MKKIDGFIRNPKKALFILAGPIVIAMLVQTLYNVVDTAFVGRLGAEAIAAVTFSFPIFFILMALNMGIAIGMSSRISRFLGARDRKSAENTAMHGIIMSVLVALLIFTATFFVLKPIFSLFGAAADVVPLAISYLSVVLVGIFFMFPGQVLSQMFVAQGDTKTPMKVQISALLLNILLDYIFIFKIGMGVKGAALATTISFTVAFFMFLRYAHVKSHLRLSIKSFKFSGQICREIFRVGAPASLMMLLMSIYIIFINKLMASFGTNYVASFGIVSRLESVAVMPVIALSTALLTLVGMFYGAKRYDLLKNIMIYGVKVAVLFTSIVGLLFFLFPTLFLRIFTPDTALLALTAPYLRIEVLMFPFMAIGITIGRAMQGMGLGMPALMITVVRILVVAVPFAYISVLVLGFGYLSIAVAMVLGGFVASIMAVVWLNLKLKKLA